MPTEAQKRWWAARRLLPLWLKPEVARHIRRVARERGFGTPKRLVLSALMDAGVFEDAPAEVRSEVMRDLGQKR